MLYTASMLNISFISIDRYYAVCQPLHYRTKITTYATGIMILISWSVAAFVGFGMEFLGLYILGIEDYYYENVACVGGCVLFLTETASLIASFLLFTSLRLLCWPCIRKSSMLHRSKPVPFIALPVKTLKTAHHQTTKSERLQRPWQLLWGYLCHTVHPFMCVT